MADFPNELVKAVFDNDAKRFFQLVEEGHFSPQFVVNIGYTEHAAMPLYHITICWDIVLSKYDEWKEYKEIVYKKKCENDKIKKFFVSQFGIDMKDISFSEYKEKGFLYCDDDDKTIEDFFDESKEGLIERGHRCINIDLYCSASKLNFEETERLLKEGANPNEKFFMDGMNESIYDTIDTRCALVESELKEAIIGNGIQHQDFRYSIAFLLQLASLEKMFILLRDYTTR